MSDHPRSEHTGSPAEPTSETAATKDLVRQQFGANAINYATSVVHAKGASLGRLVELMAPEGSWKVLDIATAAGHTAFAMAPHVSQVIASDLVDQMLDVARSGAAERGLGNVGFEPADAEALPFDDASFDAVTCRIAPHHFANPERFIAEVARVLRPGGVFGLVDNMVNDEASAFVNDWERRRDPSHVMALSVERWAELIEAAGLSIRSTETLAKRMEFDAWVENMSVPSQTRVELLAQLEQAPEPAVAYLRPELGPPGDQSAAAFHLTEGILVATR
jgi:ubiquinone/menaquinone biosynthesis C-methylase UbiE